MFPRAAVVIFVLLLVSIATLVVVASVRMKRAEDVARCERVATDSRVFRTQLEAYRTMNGSFPTTEQGLHALVEKQLIGLIPEDPWNTKYIYRCPGKKDSHGYDLFSAGPDRTPDTADDVWRE
jgi:general secretion pathway protein G